MFSLRKFALTALIVQATLVNTALSQNERYYCVQVLSSPKLNRKLEKKFYLLRGVPDKRIEKIGSYYTIRVGFWKSKDEAEEYYRILKKLFPEALLRTCYRLPSRWVLPIVGKQKAKGKERGVFSRKLNHYKKKPLNLRNENGINFERLAKRYYFSFNTTSPEFTPFKFPQTRVYKKPSTEFNLDIFAVNPLYGRYKLYRTAFYFKRQKYSAGISIEKKEKTDLKLYVPSLILFKRELDNTNILTVQLGILQRNTIYENASNPAVSLSWSLFPFSGNFVAGFGLENGYNDTSLRDLVFTSFYGNYKFLPHLSLSGSVFFENLVKRNVDFYPFKSRTWLSGSINYRNSLFSLLTSNRGGYLLDLSAEYKTWSGLNLKLSFSSDKDLPLPLSSKGHIYTERGTDYLMVVDPLNVQKVSLKVFKKALGFSINYYRLNGNSSIMSDNYYRFKDKGFMGLSLGSYYRMTIKNFELQLYGGFFIPGTLFNDKSVKGAGGFNIRGKW